MKTEFRFSNGTSTLILIPETEREKACIRMFREGQDVRLSVSSQASPESLTVITEIAKPNQMASVNGGLPVELDGFKGKVLENV